MKIARLEISPGIWVDTQRAAWFEAIRTLAVADLHLGYAWAHRYNGQLMPLHPADQVADRLKALCDAYQPERLIFAGDVVHQALRVDAIKEELLQICDQLKAACELVLLLGNHDRGLEEILCNKESHIERSFEREGILFVHGDAKQFAAKGPKLTVIGHEHPAISLGDGVATSAKFPCFLCAPDLLVLPAFSTWVGGTSYGTYPFMSALAREARFEKAIAIMGNKLLPVPLRR